MNALQVVFPSRPTNKAAILLSCKLNQPLLNFVAIRSRPILLIDRKLELLIITRDFYHASYLSGHLLAYFKIIQDVA